MIMSLFRLIRLVLWGTPLVHVPPSEPTPLNVGSSWANGWTYGNIRTTVYLNRNYKGQPYFKVDFKRLVNDHRRGSNSFFMDELQSIEFGITRARAWVYDSNLTS